MVGNDSGLNIVTDMARHVPTDSLYGIARLFAMCLRNIKEPSHYELMFLQSILEYNFYGLFCLPFHPEEDHSKMNADAFRHFFSYHFAENRKLWNTCIMPLSQEQFTQPLDYSRGSVRNQIVHLMSCDNYWFSALRGLGEVADFKPTDFEDRTVLRTQWDSVEQGMRDYLATLRDEMLFERPLEGGDKILFLWQILLHVGNHGTDHRAQLLRQLKDLGVTTMDQDYIFYVFNNFQYGTSSDER